jgi:hypothetical protein
MLILANDDGGLFSALQDQWRCYMKSSKDIDCYFIKGRPEQDEPVVLEEDSLYFKIYEGYDQNDSLWQKTLAGFRYFEPNFNKYKFIYRTNLSSHIHFQKYLEFCKTLPTSGMCAASINDAHGYLYPSGAGFTLSMDLAKRLLEDTPNHYIMDDVTMGIALKKWNIKMMPTPRVDFTDIMTESEIDKRISKSDQRVFHFRVKTNEPNRMNKDISIHRVLYNRHYTSSTKQ